MFGKIWKVRSIIKDKIIKIQERQGYLESELNALCSAEILDSKDEKKKRKHIERLNYKRQECLVNLEKRYILQEVLRDIEEL